MALMGSTISQDNDKEVTPPSNTDNRKAGGNDMEVPIFTEAPFSDAVNDDMSFNEAFGAARKDIGPGGFFEWHGETYNTYYKEEWDALSPDERNDFFASVDDRHPNDGIVDEHEILDILNDDPNDDEINIDAEDVVINEKEEYEEVDMSDEDMVVIEPEHVPDDHHDDDIVYDDIDDDPYDHHNGDIIDNDPYDNDLDISDLG
ncbi:MAG: hypothetical protein R2798_13515 [Chitinophagales bacterium]|nr:hypothetical protein [Chitinophagales bacterium]